MPPAARLRRPEPAPAGCTIDVTAAAQPGAILQIAIAAPCTWRARLLRTCRAEVQRQLPRRIAHRGSAGDDRTARVALGFADGTDRTSRSACSISRPSIGSRDLAGGHRLRADAFEGGADY
ncbi:MAG: hypothetical protein R3D59_03705 [Paracoccaceae bacterium]